MTQTEIDYQQTFEKCAAFYEAFTGEECDESTAELLTSGAFDYYRANQEGSWSAARLALESTLSYVNTEMTEEGYDDYIEMFEDYLADCD